MAYNYNSCLWNNKKEQFFREREIKPVRQSGPHCVSTSLAILTGEKPEDFQDKINTQDPLSWSDALKNYDMKMAYCPFDARKLKFYIDELIELDDLFTLSYYTTQDSSKILSDPDEKGWVCGSHIVILHRDKIYDPAQGNVSAAKTHKCMKYHTKRIFRVVPDDYKRGL